MNSAFGIVQQSLWSLVQLKKIIHQHCLCQVRLNQEAVPKIMKGGSTVRFLKGIFHISGTVDFLGRFFFRGGKINELLEFVFSTLYFGLSTESLHRSKGKIGVGVKDAWRSGSIPCWKSLRGQTAVLLLTFALLTIGTVPCNSTERHSCLHVMFSIATSLYLGPEQVWRTQMLESSLAQDLVSRGNNTAGWKWSDLFFGSVFSHRVQ